MKTSLVLAAVGSLFLAIGVADARPKAKKSGKLKEGEPAPKFRLRALDGAIIRLDELAYPGREKSYAKKHPIFLDFFRTDCKPCLKAMPELVEMHNRHKDEGLEVVLIALLEDGDDGRAKLEKYLTEQKLPFKVAVDATENVAKLYLGDLVTLPASFLMGRTGTLEKVKYGSSGSYEDYFKKGMAKVLKAHAKALKKKKK